MIDFTPPHPPAPSYPPASSYPPYPYAAPHPVSYPPQPGPAGFVPFPAPLPATASPRTGISALSVVSLVLSATALLGVVGLMMLFLAGVGPSLAAGDDSGVGVVGGQQPLTGQLSQPPSGTLRGDALGVDVSRVITDDGGVVTDMRCPDTETVRQGTVTMCHSTISGETWAVAVFFEDAQGRFTLELM